MQLLMMAYERSKRAWDSFGKFIYQFQLETKTFNQTCLNERLLPNYTHTHIHMYLPIQEQEATQDELFNGV